MLVGLYLKEPQNSTELYKDYVILRAILCLLCVTLWNSIKQIQLAGNIR